MTDQLTIPITADTKSVKQAEKELDNLEISVKSVKKAIMEQMGSWGKYANVVTACATSFLAVKTAVQDFIIAPLSGAAKSFMELGDTISKTSQRVGMGVDTLGGLKFAAEQCGANFQTLTDGIKAFQNQLGAAQMGDAGAIGKLGKVGLTADFFAGLDNEDQLMKLADYIKDIGDKSQQTRVAMELFGKAGFKLLPFFQEGSEGIKKLIAEGKDIGAVMGEEAIEDAVAMTDAMNRLKTSAAGVSNVFMALLAPAITSTLDFITTMTKGVSKLVDALDFWNKAMKETARHIREVNTEAIKHEQAVKAANEADQKLFDRLQELADIEDPLSNDEIREAKMLVDELEGKYGKLGITVDETAGKIHGLAEAQAILNREMAQKEIDALEQRKKALEEKRGDLSRQITEAEKANGRLWADAASGKNGIRLNKRGQAEMAAQEDRKKEFRAINEEIGGLIARQNALRGITTPDVTPSETRSQLTEKNIGRRTEQAAAKDELEGMKADTDLMSPMEKAFYELNEKYNQKSKSLNKKLELAQKAGQDTSAIYAEFNSLEQWRQDEIAKIGQAQIDEQNRAYSSGFTALRKPVATDARITAAQAQVQSARQGQANAVLAGGDLAAADAALKQAETDLAKTIAEVSGEARSKAQKEWTDAQTAYERAQREGKDNKTLNALLDAVEKAREKYETENYKYFGAVGEVRKANEGNIAEAVQTTLSSSGTFSAYGMDAAVASDFPKQALDVLKKLLDNTDEIVKEQKNEAAYSV